MNSYKNILLSKNLWAATFFISLLIISVCAIRKTIEQTIGIPVVEKKIPAKSAHENKEEGCIEIAEAATVQQNYKTHYSKQTQPDPSSLQTVDLQLISIEYLKGFNSNAPPTIEEKISHYILYCNLKLPHLQS